MVATNHNNYQNHGNYQSQQLSVTCVIKKRKKMSPSAKTSFFFLHTQKSIIKLIDETSTFKGFEEETNLGKAITQNSNN
jgi:hypothetical protein